MKYLTKQWYALSQLTQLHIDMKVLNEVSHFDDSLFLKLYKDKLEDYLKAQRESYDLDPRFMLDEDGSAYIGLDVFMQGEQLTEKDVLVYEMADEIMGNIQTLIEEFDSRLPFDAEKNKDDFRRVQGLTEKENKHKVPQEIYHQIADPRVFALGYCSKEIYDQLIKLSEENTMKTNSVLDEYYKAQQSEIIPEEIREKFGFHDCKVIDFINDGEDIILLLDNYGQYAEYNRITFKSSQIFEQDGDIVGSFWVHEELYRSDSGYEVHVLLSGEVMHELILTCKSVVIDNKI